MKTCSIDGCDNKMLARGWCNKHYQRWRTHGDPNKVTPMGKWPKTTGMEMQGTRKATVKPTVKDLHWAAGFIEGEGCFSRGTSQRIDVEQVDREPLDKLQAMFGGRTVRRRAKREGWNPTFAWYVYGSRARGIMMTLYPLLSERRQGKIKEALRGKD